jgi:poly(3-hydroxybutyrate) depolymerase
VLFALAFAVLAARVGLRAEPAGAKILQGRLVKGSHIAGLRAEPVRAAAPQTGLLKASYTGAAGTLTYTVARYSDGHGGDLLEYWVVHGMAHAWSGGCSCEPYSDPSGPDETLAMYDFFMSHPAP